MSARTLAAFTAVTFLVSNTLPGRAEASERRAPGRLLENLLVLGAGAMPEHEGSAERSAIPVLGLRLGRGHRYASVLGTTATVNLVDRADVEIGPALNYAFGRDGTAESSAAPVTAEIDPTVELGAFVAWNLTDDGDRRFPLRLEAQLLGDVGGVHDSWRANVGASRAVALAPRWLIEAGASLSFTGDGYADAWFSVSDAEAAAGGMAPYDADGGLHDAGASLDVRHLLSERLSLGARVAWRRLLGDAADSPIVTDEGDSDQVLTALSVGWRF